MLVDEMRGQREQLGGAVSRGLALRRSSQRAQGIDPCSFPGIFQPGCTVWLLRVETGIQRQMLLVVRTAKLFILIL